MTPYLTPGTRFMNNEGPQIDFEAAHKKRVFIAVHTGTYPYAL
jgi:hypothetical protein